MRFFKHYSDNHRGQFMQALFQEFGHEGPCCFYFLMEMCAEKIEHDEDGQLITTFTFSEQIVRRNLHISSTKVEKFLNFCQTFSQLFWKKNNIFIEIEMPILLKLLDRDMKKPRKTRATSAQNTRLDKDKDRDKDKEENITKEKTLQQVVGDSVCGVITLDKEVSTQDIELLYAKYPRKEGKTKGMQKLQKQIKTKQDLADLAKAIDVYSKLSAGKEKQFIKHFATFASCWKDYLQEGIESDAGVVDENEILLSKFTAKLGANYE